MHFFCFDLMNGNCSLKTWKASNVFPVNMNNVGGGYFTSTLHYFLFFADAFDAYYIVRLSDFVVAILGMSGFAQITQPIIAFYSIDMINFVFRPCAVAYSPSCAVSRNVYFLNTKRNISDHTWRSSGRTSFSKQTSAVVSAISIYFPKKQSGNWIVLKKSMQSSNRWEWLDTLSTRQHDFSLYPICSNVVKVN